MRGFVAHEALHTRERLAYNAALQSCVDARTLDAEVAEHLAFVRDNFAPVVRPAIACALEHLTAIVAREVLDDPSYLEGADRTYARLWTWHALEEVERKAVAYDVFARVAGRPTYGLRVRTIAFATTPFVRSITKHIVKIMQSQGEAKSARAWFALPSSVFVRPGLARRIIIPYLRYYAPGFHPEFVDDRRVVEGARSRIEARI